MSAMKDIRWSDEKDAFLRADPNRGGIGLVECAEAIRSGRVLDVVDNASVHHLDQQMFLLILNDYVVCVPFVASDDYIFLKTMFPSRKLTAQYLERRQ